MSILQACSLVGSYLDSSSDSTSRTMGVFVMPLPLYILFDPHLLLGVCQVLVQKDGFQGRPSFVDGQEVFAPIVRRASVAAGPVDGHWDLDDAL